jgi:sec-independent protein translocase protein TatB
MDASFAELILLFVIGLVVLGPERLPKVARKIGHFVGYARRMSRNLQQQIEDELELEELRKSLPERVDLKSELGLDKLEQDLRGDIDPAAGTGAKGNRADKQAAASAGAAATGAASKGGASAAAAAAIASTTAADETAASTPQPAEAAGDAGASLPADTEGAQSPADEQDSAPAPPAEPPRAVPDPELAAAGGSDADDAAALESERKATSDQRA